MTEQPEPPEQKLEAAIALHQSGDLSKAENVYREVLEADPENPTALHLLGVVAFQTGNNDAALTLIAKALKHQPNYPEALNNMGNVLAKLDRLGDAMLCFREAVIQRPDYVIAFNHLGSALKGMGHLDEAVGAYKQAVVLDSEGADAHFNLGHLYLLMGNFEDGWREYGWRERVEEFKHPKRPYAQPVWDGGNPDGKTLFFYPEQGLGDILQFIRYLPQVAADGGRVVLETPTQLARLLEGFEAAPTLVITGEQAPDFDCHASLLDLPRILGTALDTIPAPERYIDADPALIKVWSERLEPKEGFRVSLVWGGNPDHTNDAKRSMDPALLKPLAEIPGVSLYSLQVGRDGEAKAAFGDAVTDLASELKDFADTAAVIRNLDLVISVDTSVAHMAGVDAAAVYSGLALVDGPGRQPLVSLHAAVPPGRRRGLARRYPQSLLGAFRTGGVIEKI